MEYMKWKNMKCEKKMKLHKQTVTIWSEFVLSKNPFDGTQFKKALEMLNQRNVDIVEGGQHD